MIQLKVYPTTSKIQSQQIFIDLYDSVPIKLTLSIEDITDADATSVFSRTFKVPATRNNNLFFTNVFEINGVDYDVTVKKPAEILVDGQEFRQGHIRLQKIYVNGDLDKTDYELLFLGETRDFSTVIGDAPLCQLLMPDLQALDALNEPRNPTVDDVETSWLAFPQSVAVDSLGNPNAGLANGNIIYPLIDHGNNYDEAGAVVGSTMQLGNGAGVNSFTTPGYPLPLSRLKPMIRAKRIVDQIFEDAGYTYTSEFFNSPRFHQMYVSAFGNEANIGYSVGSGSGENLLNADYSNSSANQGYDDALYLPQNVYDPGNNYQVGTYANGSRYIAPADAAAGDSEIKYRIVASAYIDATREISCPSLCLEPVAGRLQLVDQTTGQVYKSSGWSYDQTVSFTFDTEFDGVGILAGAQLVLQVEGYEAAGNLYYHIVNDIQWQVQQAPGTLLPTSMLDCDYKQIDFIKDLLKMFRLVLSPDRNNTNNFIVEPWQTYINSGDLHDWSHKLVNNKDVVLEPLFNTQSEEIEFRFKEDEDWVNKFHFDQYKEPYGYLKFDSNNELLKGTRQITTLGIAPTPLATIQEDAVSANHFSPGFIFPQIHVHETEDTVLQHLPIKPKTRFLFYNGLAQVPQTGGNLRWYLQTNSNQYTTYPLVSPYENWPMQSDGLNLNWYNDIYYWQQTATTAVYGLEPGGTLYTEYWSRYINSLYNKFSRRMTAYFVLNNVDLQDLSFDDTIFVNGKYYRPEKIIDVNIGERTEVKVQLITANDYTPPVYIDETLTNFSIASTDELCGCDGIITVTTDGATPFTWSLSNGQTGQVATTGGNPQQFDITGICSGAYNVFITDDLGRSNSGSAVIDETIYGPITTDEDVTADTSCGTGGNCTGEVTITPGGGAGGTYTVTWQYGQSGPTIGPTLTGLCGNTTQAYTITDDITGCIQAFEVTIPCGDPVYILKLSKHLNCSTNSSAFVYAESNVNYNIGTTVDLVELPGCYAVVANEQGGPPLYTIANSYTDCADCEGITPPQIFKALSVCKAAPNATPIKYIDAAAQPGLVIGEVVKFSGSDTCYTVTELIYSNNAVSQITEVFSDCEDCNAVGVNKYVIEGCNGFTPGSPEPTGGSIVGTGFNASNREYAISPLFTDETHFSDLIGGTAPLCDRQLLLCTGTNPDGTSTPPAGWYWFQILIRLENLVALPSDAVISLVRILDPVVGNDFGEIIDVLETFEIIDKGLGNTNVYTVDSAASHYLPPNVNQRFGLVIHRADGGACVQGGGTNLDFAVLNDVPGTPFYTFTYLEAYWLGDFASGTVMEANGTLNIGDVITVNESEAQGCYEVIGSADPDETTEFTYNEDNGVYATCEDCTGGTSAQHCTEITAGASGAVITYYYDDGGVCASCVGLAQITKTFANNEVATICAQLASIVVVSGALVSTLLSDETCSRYVDPISGVVGTTCDTPTVATKYCYTITANGIDGEYATCTWTEDATFRRTRLLTGESITVCANENSIVETSGSISVTGGVDACSTVADCAAACYRYAYDGPPKRDLFYINCDGTLGYINDVYLASYQNANNLIDACIAEITGGSGAGYLTQYSTCT